jgi:hypothetical protein
MFFHKEVIMASKWYFSLFCLFAFYPALLAADAKKEDSADLKWARGIAKDFWEAYLNGDGEAGGLLSPELSKSLTIGDSSADRELLLLTLPYRHSAVVVVSEEIAPDRNELILRETLSGKKTIGEETFEQMKVTADYTLRIAKESGGGRWSIRYFRLKERAQKSDKTQ